MLSLWFRNCSQSQQNINTHTRVLFFHNTHTLTRVFTDRCQWLAQLSATFSANFHEKYVSRRLIPLMNLQRVHYPLHEQIRNSQENPYYLPRPFVFVRIRGQLKAVFSVCSAGDSLISKYIDIISSNNFSQGTLFSLN